MYEPLKVVIIGKQWFEPKLIVRYLKNEIEVLPLSDSYPLEKLDYIHPIHALVFNLALASPALANHVEQIRQRYPKLPILIALSDQHLAVDSILLTKAGATDYFFPQYELSVTGDLLRQYCESYAKLTLSWKEKWMDPKLGIIPAELLPRIQSATGRHTGLQLQFFGPLALYFKGRLVDLPKGTKPRAILAYLLYHYPKRISRAKLIRQFWPDIEVASAGNNLSVQIHHIRKGMQLCKKTQLITCEHDAYFLSSDSSPLSDLSRFRQYYEEGKGYESQGNEKGALPYYQQAVSLYRGDFLEDLLSESWTVYIRETMLDRYFYMLAYIANTHFEHGQYAEAAEYWKHILQKDNAMEKAHRRLIQCYLAMGRTAQAIRQYRECKSTLYDYLRSKPAAATTELVQEWL